MDKNFKPPFRMEMDFGMIVDSNDEFVSHAYPIETGTPSAQAVARGNLVVKALNAFTLGLPAPIIPQQTNAKDILSGVFDPSDVEHVKVLMKTALNECTKRSMALRLLNNVEADSNLTKREVRFKKCDREKFDIEQALIDVAACTYVQTDRMLFQSIRDEYGEPKPEERTNVNAETFMNERRKLQKVNVPTVAMAFASTVWAGIVAEPSLMQVVDPCVRLDDVMSGNLGVMYGADMYSDAFRDPRLRVLNYNELFTFGPATSTGRVQIPVIDNITVKEDENDWVWEFWYAGSFSYMSSCVAYTILS